MTYRVSRWNIAPTIALSVLLGHVVATTQSGDVRVQEQLGLKLEPARGPVNVLVIDRVEQLTAEK